MRPPGGLGVPVITQMARRRFRSTQRHEPVTERSFQEYLYSTAAPLTNRTELMRLVRGGEDTYLELKVKLSNSERIAQGIVALANTGGGVIVFGVNDQMRVEGIDHPEEVQDELVRICREEIVPPAEILERYLLLARNNGGDIMPTIAAVLLFGRDESVSRLLPRSALVATRFGGDTNQAPVIEHVELRGNLATIYEAALRFIR